MWHTTIALIFLILLVKLFSGNETERMISQPESLLNTGIVFALIAFYLVVMLINIFHQSLKSSGTKDALSWYASPAAIMLAFYLTAKNCPVFI